MRTTYGTNTAQRYFRMAETADHGVSGLSIYVDHINGIDGLDPKLYLEATKDDAPTPATSTSHGYGYKFKTLNAAALWINRIDHLYISCFILGTSSTDKMVLSADCVIKSKSTVFLLGESLALPAYLDCGTRRIYAVGNRNAMYLANMNIVGSISDYIIARKADIGIFNCNITIAPIVGAGLFLPSSGQIFIEGGVTINFTANNQILFNPKASYFSSALFPTHITTVCVFNVGSFTGLQWCSANRTFITYFSSSIALSVPSSINLSNSAFQFNQNSALGITTFDNLNYNYPLNLGTTKPTRWTDLLPSSPDLAGTTLVYIVENELGEHGKLDMEWTTATRPITPRAGQSGYNSTLGQREYFNGSSVWIQY